MRFSSDLNDEQLYYEIDKIKNKLELASYVLTEIFDELCEIAFEKEILDGLLNELEIDFESDNIEFLNTLIFLFYKEIGLDFDSTFDSDSELNIISFVHRDIIESIKLIKEQNDPYINNIKVIETQQGKYKLINELFEAYEFEGTISFKFNKKGLIIPDITFTLIDQTYLFLQDIEDPKRWTSVTPSVVIAMEQHIKKAKGDVLTLGLGLGYYAYMVALKDDVKSVTIVEKEQDIIDLFEANILPQFPNKDKIHIVLADAYEYMENLEDGRYTCCFCDIFNNQDDIEPYLRLKTICTKFTKTKISYFMENFFIYLIKVILSISLQNELFRHMQLPVKDEPEFNYFEFKYIENLYKKTEITSLKQIKKLCEEEEILKALDQQKYRFNDTTHKKRRKK